MKTLYCLQVDIPLSSALYICFAIPSFVHFSRTTSLVLSAKLFNLFSTSWPTHRQFYHRCKSEYKKFQQIFRLFLKLLFLNCGRPNLLTDLDPRSKYEPRRTNSASGFGPQYAVFGRNTNIYHWSRCVRHVCHGRQNCSGTGVIGNYGVAQGTGASFKF